MKNRYLISLAFLAARALRQMTSQLVLDFRPARQRL